MKKQMVLQRLMTGRKVRSRFMKSGEQEIEARLQSHDVGGFQYQQSIGLHQAGQFAQRMTMIFQMLQQFGVDDNVKGFAF